ncbi:MAG: type I DNA topoisomerase, partial [Clostridia bacterium]|nr:type I DNA topoisomerase [Clostridia bacterium]
GKLTVSTGGESDDILQKLQNAAFTVQKVKSGTRRLQPAPPFITSTLQQEANRRLGFPARRTMQAAQELYEGVEVEGIGATGLITYMRTDSLRISEEARAAGNAYIKETYGESYLPEKPRYFKSKASAQDAHEAIRPSMPSLTPDRVKSSLTSDQYRLYKLIWERFIASLMAACVQDTCQVDIEAAGYIFKASGYTVKFDGYTTLYTEAKDEDEEAGVALPPLKEGDVLTLRDLTGNQHFTQPPPRYNEATLVKAFEERGIGRPSTYATTISTILSREYIEREGKSLKPTALGEITTGLMKEQFPQIVDVEFTAQMEEGLDHVESGKTDWVEQLDEFYADFSKTLKAAEESLSGERIKVPEVESDVVCENCGRKMVVKSGRFGKFLACPGYPDCKNTKQFVEMTKGVCPKCGGQIISKKSKSNRKFFGCANYPKCDFVTWNEPVDMFCPTCGKTMFRKKGKNGGVFCMTEGCQ